MTTTLPPLPLIEVAPADRERYNGATHTLLIDNSTLEQLQACPRLMQYSYLNKRVLVSDRPALNFGGALHAGLAARYRLAGARDASDVTTGIETAIEAHFAVHPQPPDDFRQLGFALRTIAAYNQCYGNEPFDLVTGKNGNPLVESSFWFYLGNVCGTAIIYIGRIDLVLRDAAGIWVMDHKTSSVYGDTFWEDMRMSAQQLGYCVAVKHTLGIQPVGYIINGIRVRRPTKADQLIESVDPAGPTLRADDFARRSYFVDDGMLAEWQNNVVALVSEFFFHYDRNYLPRKTRWCVGKYGKCQYFEVCSAPDSARAEILASTVFADNEWSPLNQPNKTQT